jgi:hypothetical protein
MRTHREVNMRVAHRIMSKLATRTSLVVHANCSKVDYGQRGLIEIPTLMRQIGTRRES